MRPTAPDFPRVRPRAAGIALLAAAMLVTQGCSRELEEVPEQYLPTNAHEAYRHGLIEADLGATALGRDWIDAADAALRKPVEVTAPFQESGYFDQTTVAAIGYAFQATGGQRIDAEIEIDANGPMRIFMDLFRLVDDSPRVPVHVATGATLVEPRADGGATPVAAPERIRRLSLEPLRDGTYVLRVQPELLRNARYTVRITVDASLTFPVAGHGTGSIQSVFGADRDGGRRSHRGVDIFAPRGTPVLAASDGVVTRANTTAVGGNVVWVSDAHRNMRLYYAHLDSHTVERGQQVQAGDQLGTVGNSGNAITTPPHLHFGVYARGAVDPDPFLRRVSIEPSTIRGDPTHLGGWSRTIDPGVELLAGPAPRAPVLAALEVNTPMQIWGASARWYRVILPDGATGYISAEATEPATPLRSAAVADPARVLDRPEARATVIDELSPGAEVPVLGAFGAFLYVQTPTGRTGWLLPE